MDFIQLLLPLCAKDASSPLENDRVEPPESRERAAAATSHKSAAQPKAAAGDARAEDDERTENDIDLSYSIEAERPRARDANGGVGQKRGAAVQSRPAARLEPDSVSESIEGAAAAAGGRGRAGAGAQRNGEEGSGTETEPEVSISLTETQLSLTASVLDLPETPADFEARLREQERRSAQTVELLTQRKRTLKDKTRADLKWMDHERERLTARRDDYHQRAETKKERQCLRELHALERHRADHFAEYKRENEHIK